MLIVAKGGAKLVQVPPPAGPLGGSASPSGGVRLSGNVEMSFLAQALSLRYRCPVIDMTGMPGIYHISIDYLPDQSVRPGGAASAGAAGDGSMMVATMPGFAIADAMERQLGLKLEPRKVPIEMLIVDHVEKTPTGN